MDLTYDDLRTLVQAKEILDHPGLAAKISRVIGRPVEAGIQSLPNTVRRWIFGASRHALRLGLQAMVSTMDHAPGTPASRGSLYPMIGGVSGAAGGFFGLAALPIELPVSTLLILRSIAEIARSQGEDLGQADLQLACLEVLALGGTGSSDDDAETGYYATRVGLAQSLSAAAQYIGSHGFARKLATPLTSLLSRVAARFSMRITESMVAKALPVVGAASGAAINALFIQHFQDMAWAHFSIRRLERKYNAGLVQRRYLALPASTGAASLLDQAG